MHWEADKAFHAFSARVEERYLEFKGRAYMRPKHEHLGCIEASGRFRYIREALLHAREEGDAARFIGLSMTNSADRLLREELATAEELDVDGFKRTIEMIFAGQTLPWYFGYRIRLAVK